MVPQQDSAVTPPSWLPTILHQNLTVTISSSPIRKWSRSYYQQVPTSSATITRTKTATTVTSLSRTAISMESDIISRNISRRPTRIYMPTTVKVASSETDTSRMQPASAVPTWRVTALQEPISTIRRSSIPSSVWTSCDWRITASTYLEHATMPPTEPTRLYIQ